MKYLFLLAIGACLGVVISSADAGGGLTSDMIRVALSSAHIDTRPGAQMRLLDRTTGQWHDFRLNSFSVRANGSHATIDINATRLD